MKTLMVFSFLIINACFSQNVLNNKNDSIPDECTDTTELSMDKTVKYDSAQIKIAKYYFVTGKIAGEDYTDTLKGLRYEKNYCHGILENEGAMDITNKAFHMGIWKYYLSSGKMKEINFDSTSQISSYKAMQIAKLNGYIKGKLEIDEVFFEGTYFWRVEHWTEQSGEIGKGEYMMIRRSTGKVTIPKDNKLIKWD